MEQNEGFAARYMNDEDFQEVVGKHLLAKVYGRVRAEGGARIDTES